MRSFSRFVGTAAWTFIALCQSVGGQEPAPSPTPQRAQRILAVGHVAFLGQWQPSTTVGGLWQISLVPTRVVPGEFGEPSVIPPRWYLHTMASGGIAFHPADESQDITAAAYGQLGFIRRMDKAITALGPTSLVASSPRAYGAALRVEVMDNLGVQIGWVRLDESGRNRWLVSVDYFKKLCEDLGFGMIC